MSEREREREEEKGTGGEDVAARSYCRACCEDVIAFKEGGKVLLLRERERETLGYGERNYGYLISPNFQFFHYNKPFIKKFECIVLITPNGKRYK